MPFFMTTFSFLFCVFFDYLLLLFIFIKKNHGCETKSKQQQINKKDLSTNEKYREKYKVIDLICCCL
jgi:hypothetical protein